MVDLEAQDRLWGPSLSLTLPGRVTGDAALRGITLRQHFESSPSHSPTESVTDSDFLFTGTATE